MKSAKWPPWNNQPIILYHGTIARSATEIVQNGIDLSLGRPNVDFGRGFYTTTSRMQAQKWAEVVADGEGETPAIVRVTMRRASLSRLRTLAFVRGTPDATDYWSFVSHCRRKLQRSPYTDQYYDVVYEPIAQSWFGIDESKVFPGYDQISFHGSIAQQILRNPNLCEMEVLG